MARATPTHQRVTSIIALAVAVALGWIGLGSGFLNGDAAVYAHQAGAGDWSQRTVHLGYLMVATALGGRPLLLDGLTWLSGIALAFGVGRLALQEKRDGVLAGAAALVGVLPILCWAEVDLPWIAAITWAASSGPLGGAVFTFVAVTLSPVALLAIPWTCGVSQQHLSPNTASKQRSREARSAKYNRWLGIGLGALLAIVALSLFSGGDWWWGDRGVLSAPTPRPGRGLKAWVTEGPAILLALALWFAARDRRATFWALLLLLAPPDVPGWGILAVSGALTLPRIVPAWVATVLLVGQLGLSGAQWVVVRGTVRAESRQIEAAARQLLPDHGLLAPWTVGVRVSLAATGDPYALRWMAQPPVRDQAARWCVDPPARAWRWEDGLREVPVPDTCDEARPNLVLIVGCTVRKDRITPQTMPRLTAFFRQGTVFTDTIAAAPWTRPALTAINTGLHAVQVGNVEPDAVRNERVLPETTVTFAERLAEAGYATFAASANPNFSPTFGFDQGFDRFHAPSPRWEDGVVKVSAGELMGPLWQRVEAAQTPVFLEVVLVEAHAPVDSYDSGLAALDAGLGDLLDGLAARGFDGEDTVFAFIGDHGEGLGDPPHHGNGHGRYPYPSTVEVPFAVMGPGIPRGGEQPRLTSQVEVADQLVRLIGLTSSSGATEPKAFVDTWFLGTARSAVYTPDRACVLEASTHPQPEEKAPMPTACFDRSDPTFTNPIDAPDLMEALVQWRATKVAGLQERLAAEQRPSEDLERQLEVLGYVDGTLSPMRPADLQTPIPVTVSGTVDANTFSGEAAVWWELDHVPVDGASAGMWSFDYASNKPITVHSGEQSVELRPQQADFHIVPRLDEELGPEDGPDPWFTDAERVRVQEYALEPDRTYWLDSVARSTWLPPEGPGEDPVEEVRWIWRISSAPPEEGRPTVPATPQTAGRPPG